MLDHWNSKAVKKLTRAITTAALTLLLSASACARPPEVICYKVRSGSQEITLGVPRRYPVFPEDPVSGDGLVGIFYKFSDFIPKREFVTSKIEYDEKQYLTFLLTVKNPPFRYPTLAEFVRPQDIVRNSKILPGFWEIASSVSPRPRTYFIPQVQSSVIKIDCPYPDYSNKKYIERIGCSVKENIDNYYVSHVVPFKYIRDYSEFSSYVSKLFDWFEEAGKNCPSDQDQN